MKLNLTPIEWVTVAICYLIGWAILAGLHHFGLPDYWYGCATGAYIVALIRAAEIQHNDAPHDDEETTP